MTRRRAGARRGPGSSGRPGEAPGTVIAPEGAEQPRLRVVAFDDTAIHEAEIASLAEIDSFRDRPGVLWVDVVGLGDSELLLELAARFGLHHLALEDVVNPHQRPKTDTYPDQLYVVSHIARADGSGHELASEQISLFLGQGYVITIQERPDDCFDAVRERLADPARPIRSSGADYLLYALVDAIVDHWFPLLESLSDRIGEIEDEILEKPDAGTITRIRRMKRDLVKARRLIWPMRDAVSALERDGSGLVAEGTRTYLRDCYDHCLRVIDLAESYRDQISGLSDAYMSSVGHRMNEIMALLTLIATIFIPLSFIASLYGMNFDAEASPWNMPELRWRYGYPAALVLMGIVAGAMLTFFWRKGWIGGRRGGGRGAT